MDQQPRGITTGLVEPSDAGFVAGWPAEVQAIYRMMSAARQPMMLSWGPELITAYNEPFLPILGSKHPRAFGCPYREVWPEVWPTLKLMIAPVLAGQAAFFENMEFTLAGRDTATGWFSFSVTPLRDVAGVVGGFAIAVVETTATVLIQRRVNFGLALEQALRHCADERAVMQDAARLLGEYMGVQRCTYATVDMEAETLAIASGWTTGVHAGLDGVQPVAVFCEQGMAALRAGEAISLAGADPAPASAPVSWLLPAALIIPLVKEDILVALILVDQDRPRAWTNDDRDLMRDVSNRTWAAAARIRAEAAIKELNQTLELRVAERTAERDRLWSLAQEVIVILAADDDTFLSVNPAAQIVMGYTPEEMLGQTVDDFLHLDDQADLRRRRLVGDGKRTKVENRYRHRDGTYRTMAWNVVYESSIAYATGRDVTEERTAQALLRESEAQMKAVFETSYQLKGLLDIDGRLLAVNAIALDAIGQTSADVIGRPLWETPWFTATEGLPDLIRGVVQAAARGESFRAELDAVLPGGRRRFDLSVRPIRDQQGTIFAIMPEAVDVTDQRATEAALRQSQKMEAVGQLTGGLAHDFNNLLTGIGGALELIQTRLAGKRTGDAVRYATAAQDSVRRAAALTHRLLAFSRQQTLLPRLLDAGSLVSDMAELIRGTVGPAITVEVRAPPGVPSILVDANQLENAVLNLCLNARDAMPGGGHLLLAIDTLPAHAGLPGPVVVLRVADTGAGMHPEIVARAFDPFFTTKPIGAGTGLGLSMVYGFVCQSEGQVSIASVAGTGTTVTLLFPARADCAAATDELASRTPGPGQGETVLVVEDEEAIQLLIDDVLTDYGYTVLLAADGAAGLAALRSDQRIDLLVTDIGLPGGMNGRQLADAARVLRPSLPVLMITGFAAVEVLGHDRLQSGMAIMTKPFTMSALAQGIQELLAHPFSG